MKAFSVRWNPNKDETVVSLSEEFANADWLIRADVLKDALQTLEKFYNDALLEGRKNG